jgi:hypothetical protein
MSRIRRLVEVFVACEPIDMAIRATLIVFLLGPNLLGLEWQYRLLFHIISAVGLILPAVGRSAPFWCAVSAIMFFKTVDHWWMQDNHVFLLTWWCFTIALALYAEDTERVVKLNARWLVGLSFALATLWKGLLSPDYMSGDYFYYTFLTDARFMPIGMLFGGMSAEDYQHNFSVMNQVSHYLADVQTVQLKGTEGLRWLTLAVTWWTVLIEGALAILFLAPTSSRLSRYRHAALLLFAWTTYLAAPVKTFGWTLTTLGLAQCDRDQFRLRLCYLLTYPLLLIYEQAPIWEMFGG